MCGIYLITNKINGKKYVGQSVDMERRFRDHVNRAFNSSSSEFDSPLHRAFRKYGVDNFSFTVLVECEREKLNTLEKDYIQRYNTLQETMGYNVDGGGQTGNSSQKFTQEQVDRIIAALKQGLTYQKIIDTLGYGSLGTINGINYGSIYHDENIQYPIVDIKEKYRHKCKICGKPCDSHASMCLECYKKSREKSVDLSETSTVLDELFASTLTDIGLKYSCSRSHIQRTLKKNGIPYHIQDFRQWFVKTYPERAKKSNKKLYDKIIKNEPIIIEAIKNGEVVGVFSSYKEAGLACGSAHVKEVCEGKRLTSNGYVFRQRGK